MSATLVKQSSVQSLLAIIVLQIDNYDDVIKKVFVDPKMQKRISITLALIKKKAETHEIYDLLKFIPDINFMYGYVFPFIVIILKNYIHDIMIEMMEISCEKSSSQEYRSFCDFAKRIIDDYKNIESVLGSKGLLEKIRQFKTMVV